MSDTKTAHPAVYIRHFNNGIAFCKANHGTLADRWQEIGRQQCEQTHPAIRKEAFDTLWRQASDLGYEEALFACRQTHRDLRRAWRVEFGRRVADHCRLAHQHGARHGRRQGAVLGLGVAFALAVVAGALGRRWGR